MKILWIISCITLVSVFLILHSDSLGQSKKKKNKVYITRITDMQLKDTLGILKEVKDSSIVLLINQHEVSLPSSSIKRIKIKRDGAAGHGALNGGLVGLGVSSVLLLSNPEEAGYAPVVIPFFVGVGSLIGAIGGAMDYKEKIIINGSQLSFREKIEIMNKYSQSSSQGRNK